MVGQRRGRKSMQVAHRKRGDQKRRQPKKTTKHRGRAGKEKELFIPQLIPIETKRIEPKEYDFELPQQEVEVGSAPYWRRILAYILDSMFVYFVLFQIFLLVFLPKAGIPLTNDWAALESYINSNRFVFMKMIVASSTFFIIQLFYFMVAEVNFGTTLGKRFLGLGVISGENNKVGYWQAFIRNLTKSILFPLLIFDVISIFWTKSRQRFTEIISNTKVIYYLRLKLVYEGGY